MKPHTGQLVYRKGETVIGGKAAKVRILTRRSHKDELALVHPVIDEVTNR